MGKQLLRSGTAVAANYRAACRARSRAEFAARLGIVVEEADETMLWLELLDESGILVVAHRSSGVDGPVHCRPAHKSQYALSGIDLQITNYSITQ
jgi:23S rRNA-intervening sequence protein